MVSGHVGHAVDGNQPITGGQINARLPFGIRNFTFKRGEL